MEEAEDGEVGVRPRIPTSHSSWISPLDLGGEIEGSEEQGKI